jgi:hypothetical protein
LVSCVFNGNLPNSVFAVSGHKLCASHNFGA